MKPGALWQRLPLLAAALWWGSLAAIGFLAVPLLFRHLPSAATAGAMAAQLFAAQTWVSLACGLLLLVLSRGRGDAAAPAWAQPALAAVVLGLLLALLLQYGVAPRIVARQDLRWWHSVASGMYAVQWLCALRALWCVGAAGSKA